MNTDKKMELYKSSVDKISVSDDTAERIIGEVLSRSASRDNKRSTRSHKRLRLVPALIAAVCVTLSAGVVAYAAGNGLLSAIFRMEDIEAPDELTGKMEVYNLETYYDGLTVTPMGFASDGYVNYCVFRLDFEEDIPVEASFPDWGISSETNYFEGICAEPIRNSEDIYKYQPFSEAYQRKFDREKLFKVSRQMNEEGINDVEHSHQELRRISDKSMYFIYQFVFKNQFTGKLDLNAELVNIWTRTSVGTNENGIYFTEEPIINEPLFYADFSIDVAVNEPVFVSTRETEFYNTEVSVTPCVVRVNFIQNTKREDERVKLLRGSFYEKYVMLDDGTKIGFTGNGYWGGEKLISGMNTFDMLYKHEYWLMLDYPVDPARVTAVVIGDNVMTID